MYKHCVITLPEHIILAAGGVYLRSSPTMTMDPQAAVGQGYCVWCLPIDSLGKYRNICIHVASGKYNNYRSRDEYAKTCVAAWCRQTGQTYAQIMMQIHEISLHESAIHLFMFQTPMWKHLFCVSNSYVKASIDFYLNNLTLSKLL